MEQPAARRQLLRVLAASPLISVPSIASSIAALIASASDAASAQSYNVLGAAGGKVGDVITLPSQALNVIDFERAAKQALAGAPAHFGRLESGVVDDGTLKANRDAFERYTVRVRRLIDARRLDTSVRVSGQTWGSPIALAPVSSLGALNPEAEMAVARAAGKRKHHMIVSTVSTPNPRMRSRA
jgi:hypothetical protein